MEQETLLRKIARYIATGLVLISITGGILYFIGWLLK